jgi:IPT/TIG domain
MTSLHARLRRWLSTRVEGQTARLHPATAAARDRGDESGSVLVLALIFLVVVSVIVVSLLSWLGTSLTATANIGQQRSLEAAATNAVNLAIQNTRTTFASQLVNSTPTYCWYNSGGTGQQPQADPSSNVDVDVWCSMFWQPSSTNTRQITYSACLSTVSAAQCGATPLIQAVVTFDDYTTPVVAPAPTPVPCNVTGLCGQGMTLNSWQWEPTVPAVSSISPTTSSIAGGATLTVTGTGFVPGSSVNFVQESNNVPSSANVVIPAQPATCVTVLPNNTCTQLTVTTPAVTSGTDYFVTVSTPGGTSPYVNTVGTTDLDDLQYTTFQPTITGISGPNMTGNTPQGSVGGGSTITLTGTGFFNATNFAAQVSFWSGNTSFQATNVVVNSETSLTATSPAVTSTGTWYVVVSTIGGSSSGTGFNFLYGAQVPLVINTTPTTGGPSSKPAVSSVSITGSNFLASQTAVAFYTGSITSTNYCGLFSSGISASTPNVTSSTALTATLPTGSNGLVKGTAYYIIVATTVSGTQYCSHLHLHGIAGT